MGRTHARSPTEVWFHQLYMKHLVLHMVTTAGMALHCFFNYMLKKKHLSLIKC